MKREREKKMLIFNSETPRIPFIRRQWSRTAYRDGSISRKTFDEHGSHSSRVTKCVKSRVKLNAKNISFLNSLGLKVKKN